MKSKTMTDREIGFAFTPSRGALVASSLASHLAKHDGAEPFDVAGHACLVAELAASMVIWREEGAAVPEHRRRLREALARVGAKLIERREGKAIELFARLEDQALIRLA